MVECMTCLDAGWYDTGDGESGPSPMCCICPTGMAKSLVVFGMCANQDEAAHMLVDMGEINSTQHAALLSHEEARRVYGL